jgi:Cu(I)/Ag(I) efflux system protein CusF
MNKRIIEIIPLAMLAALLLVGRAQAQAPAVDHAAHHTESSSSEKALPLIDGEVRRIDKAAGKLTIKHAPIPNLDMPAMTMVFVAGEAAMLDQVKTGDKIRFSVDKLGGALTVTRIEP